MSSHSMYSLVVLDGSGRLDGPRTDITFPYFDGPECFADLFTELLAPTSQAHSEPLTLSLPALIVAEAEARLREDEDSEMQIIDPDGFNDLSSSHGIYTVHQNGDETVITAYERPPHPSGDMRQDLSCYVKVFDGKLDDFMVWAREEDSPEKEELLLEGPRISNEEIQGLVAL